MSERNATGTRTAGAPADTFARDNLPPPGLWPVMDCSCLPHLAGRERLNCAADLLDDHVAEGRGDRRAILSPAGDWTYARLKDEADRIARALVEDLGVRPGNRVLLRAPNGPMLAAAWFAVLKAGAVCVTTMPLLRARELAYVMTRSKVTLALTDARFAADLEQAAKAVPHPVQVVAWGADAGPGSLDALAGRRSGSFTNVDTRADDVALIAFTSGTTGKAKGTMHTHRDVLAVCDLFPVHILKPEPHDVFCGSPPLAFTFGLGGLLLFPMRIGAATLLLEQAAPAQLVQGIQDFRATICFTAPTAYRAMLGMLEDYDVSSLRKCVSAGEHLPLAIWQAWYDATGVRIIDGIGSTEILHIFISSAEDEIRPGSTGRVVPGYEACVVDGNGHPVPPGELGRLAVRGPTGCRYLDDPERQKTYVQHGWNITGDTYKMDEDGYFWYQARNDDMIISGGYNISGPEVENVLLTHPAVAECGVVGVPDPDRSQLVKAFVVLRPGFEGGEEMTRTLQNYVKAEIAPYKYPRRVEFVESLPRTETGKLQRFRLRTEAL